MRAWARAGVLTGVLCVCSSIALAEPAIDLAGSEWGFASETGEHARFVQFGQEGLLSGHGGCNRFGGGYVQKDTELTIEGLISTRMACAEEIMKAEDALLRGLEILSKSRASTSP